MRQVFISYSSKDFAQAQSVRHVLEQNGITCWMAPADIPGGSNYTKEIPVAIRGCQAFVLMLSNNAQKSQWVLKELDSAVNAGKIILPFQLEDVPLSDEFNFLLTGAQRYDAYQRKTEAMKLLVSRIQAIIRTDKQAPSPAAAPKPQPKSEPAQQTPAPKEETLNGKTLDELFSPYFGGNFKLQTSQPKAEAKPEAKSGISCPACGSFDLTQFPNQVKPREPLEHILQLAAFMVLGSIGFLFSGVLWMMLTDFLYFDLDVDGDLIDILYSLSPLVMVAAMVGCVILASRLVSTWLKRQRIRKHIKVTECRCNTCQKKFQAVEDL